MKTLLSVLTLVISTVLFSSEKPDHSIWDRYLTNYVSSSGTVNYKSMKVNMDSLDAYLLELRDHAPQTDWSSNEKLAYYINAYNAYTIKFVLSKYPVASVKDISFSGKDIWNFKMANLGGTNYTLNQIENDILRKMNEPRIHFAINCASKSCPKLLNEAYDADKMNSQLTSATKTFINDSKHNILAEKKLQLSALFEWYSTDFNVDGKTLIDFLNLYSNITIQAGAKIEYLEYDWSLNE